mgnify:CR=1 FL=1|jgi:multidrug efflux system outer membrane protein
MNMKNVVSALALAVVLSGCTLTPEYARPRTALPETWLAAVEKQSAEQAAVEAAWWKNFKSAELNALMDAALENNNDLLAALARIEQARASVKIAGAPLLPSASGTAGAGWNYNNPSSGASSDRGTGSAGVSVSYEVDLFGRNRAGVESAKAKWRGTIYGHDALALVVKGDVAKTYFQILNLRERIALANNNLQNSRQVLDIVEARYNAGSASALDVARQKSSLATAEAAVTALKNQEQQAQNALSILLGRAPSNLQLKAKTLRAVNIPKIPVAQPSRVVEQRPDIRAAEENLIAANADIGAARAAFFPTLNLTAGASFSKSPLSDPAASAASLAASLLAPIFRGGELQGGVERAEARQRELAYEYQTTVLTSMREVEDALSAAAAAKKREVSLATAMEEARRAYNLSRDLYEAGAADFQTMLDAERTVISAEDSHASVRLELLNAAVDLYKAVGGGWKPAGAKK